MSEHIRNQVQDGQHLANETVRHIGITITGLKPIELETYKQELKHQLEKLKLL